MSILIRNNWKFIIDEIWTSLLSEPRDIYVELLRYYYETLGFDIGKKTEILNDLDLSREEFRKISSPDAELDCIKILQGFYDQLEESYGKSVADNYLKSLKAVIEKHNLRYVITKNHEISLSLQGLIDSLLLRLRKTTEHDRTNRESLELLEASIANLNNSDVTTRNCITNANIVIESAVVDKTTNGQKTLGMALNGCPELFPFQTLFDSLHNISKFLNDYPNLRHRGDTSKRLRDLKLDDASLIAGLAICYASYIRAYDEGESILSGEI